MVIIIIYHVGDERRTIHIGLDLFVVAGHAIFAPLEGVVHSFKDNVNFQDYGPPIILKVQIRKV